RTFLAQLLAQDPQLLILDEPTNHLDLIYQKQIFGLVKEWIDHTGRAVISVVHDLSLAKAYGTDALLMEGGKLLASGTIDEVLTRTNLENAYSMDVHQWMKELLNQWEEHEK
ncbi:MAG: ABC transporter ATP-binding protein, partial [Eubacteriales bacterium]|nr:ABC transporter ATP-binding protein [Eubacteriales bacterium]